MKAFAKVDEIFGFATAVSVNEDRLDESFWDAVEPAKIRSIVPALTPGSKAWIDAAKTFFKRIGQHQPSTIAVAQDFAKLFDGGSGGVTARSGLRAALEPLARCAWHWLTLIELSEKDGAHRGYLPRLAETRGCMVAFAACALEIVDKRGHDRDEDIHAKFVRTLVENTGLGSAGDRRLALRAMCRGVRPDPASIERFVRTSEAMCRSTDDRWRLAELLAEPEVRPHVDGALRAQVCSGAFAAAGDELRDLDRLKVIMRCCPLLLTDPSAGDFFTWALDLVTGDADAWRECVSIIRSARSEDPAALACAGRLEVRALSVARGQYHAMGRSDAFRHLLIGSAHDSRSGKRGCDLDGLVALAEDRRAMLEIVRNRHPEDPAGGARTLAGIIDACDDPRMLGEVIALTRAFENQRAVDGVVTAAFKKALEHIRTVDHLMSFLYEVRGNVGIREHPLTVEAVVKTVRTFTDISEYAVRATHLPSLGADTMVAERVWALKAPLDAWCGLLQKTREGSALAQAVARRAIEACRTEQDFRALAPLLTDQMTRKLAAEALAATITD